MSRGKRKMTETSVKVECPCRTILGNFAPADDHGSISTVCPSCGKFVQIYSGALQDAIENERKVVVALWATTS